MKATRRVTTFVIFSVLYLLLLSGTGTPPLLAQTIEVNSADPPSAEQGTVNLNVTIGGKGFKRGAVARFLVTGSTTDTGGITVNSTTFHGATEVVANIDVADNATVAKFDIEVQSADGRTGKGIELFSVVAKGATLSASATILARSDYRDALGDRVRSDGNTFPCGVDYVSKTDTCTDVMADKASINWIHDTMNFLRTLASCCDNVSDPVIANLVRNPTRWLVFDFSQGVNSACPNLDQVIYGDPNRSQSANPPLNDDSCTDFLEVRFFADKAFQSGAAFSAVSIVIDSPDLIQSRQGGTRTQWNTKWTLDFVNPLTVTPDPADPNTVTLTTLDGLEQAELWTINQRTGKKDTLVGTYRMPFQVTVSRVP